MSAFKILHVYRPRYFSEVGYSIVRTIAIYMVNITDREFSEHTAPSKMMGSNLFLIHTNKNISVSFPSYFFTKASYICTNKIASQWVISGRERTDGNRMHMKPLIKRLTSMKLKAMRLMKSLFGLDNLGFRVKYST